MKNQKEDVNRMLSEEYESRTPADRRTKNHVFFWLVGFIQSKHITNQTALDWMWEWASEYAEKLSA